MARIHILGIGNILMGGIASIARGLGHQVSGSYQGSLTYSPDYLTTAGVEIREGYDPSHLRPLPDLLIVSDDISRGNPQLEYALNKNLLYTSGPQWLADQVLAKRHVLAVAGTYGKTTVSSLLAWILTQANLNPGYLIGGLPTNFSSPATLGQSPFFVIEANESITAFFDKRSQFLHYRPRTLIINNLEGGEESLKDQFQLLVSTVPSSGVILYPADDGEIPKVLSRGCWSAGQTICTADSVWHARNQNADGSRFELWHRDQKLGVVKWSMVGEHNIRNALAAVAAAHEVGVTSEALIAGLKSFQGIQRHLQPLNPINGVNFYDDLGQHSRSVGATIAALRNKVGDKRIVVVMELLTHQRLLASSLRQADKIIFLRPENEDVGSLVRELAPRATAYDRVEAILEQLVVELQADDQVLMISRDHFAWIYQRLLKKSTFNTAIPAVRELLPGFDPSHR